ncbi:MAG: MarR family transcriptional regulator [Acidimicrobiales bacterium]|jgi:DNA-binding MarR family transcriptional regulator|nr:MarR family transcriptional regulator [Acidimicrobiales bacterium]
MGKRGADVVAAEQALERLFRLTSNRTVHARQAAAVGVEVTRAGYAVLRSVDEAGQSALGEVARECSMDPAAVTRQIRALERHGLLERVAHDGDARVIVVRLTAAGRDVYRRIVTLRTAYLADVLADWSVQDRATLARLVDRLVDDLRAAPFRPVEEPQP